MDLEDEFEKAREEYRLRDEEDEYNLSMHYLHQDEEEEKKRAEEERWRKEEEDHDAAQAESHLRDKEEKRAEKDISSRPPSIMDPEEEYGKARNEERLRDEEDEYNLRMHYLHQDEEEEKKRAEEERWRREEEDHDAAQAESHLRHEEEKRAEKAISSRPPSICDSCHKKPAQFKLTISQFQSSCTCKDPISHVGHVTHLCSFECYYWDVDKRYTEGGVRFVVMGGMDECNVCGEPMMSSATFRLEEQSRELNEAAQ